MESTYYYANGVEIEPYQVPFFDIDSEELYEAHKNYHSEILDANGWTALSNGEYPFAATTDIVNDTVKLSYRFNSHGFRGIEMPEASAPRSLIALGSNMAFGMSMPEALAWPTLIGSKLGYRAISLATPNSSLDTQYRLLLAWLPRIRSEWVVIHEQHDQASTWERAEGKEFISQGLPGGHSLAVVRRDMALRSMKHLCEQFGAKFIHIPPDVELKDNPDYGRDLLSPGRRCHRYIAYQAMKKMGVME